MQNCSDVSAKALTVATNHPYIVVIPSDSAVQFCIIVERNVLIKSKYFQCSLLSLIAAYYVFGIEYPTSSKSSLIFDEYFLLTSRVTKFLMLQLDLRHPLTVLNSKHLPSSHPSLLIFHKTLTPSIFFLT